MEKKKDKFKIVDSEGKIYGKFRFKPTAIRFKYQLEKTYLTSLTIEEI